VSEDPGNAFRSCIRISFQDDAPPLDLSRPGDVTDVDDPALRELRRRVVEPVATALLSADELEEIVVSRGAGQHRGDIWVQLGARGETFQQVLTGPGWDPGPDAAAEALAARLADHLEGWVCETAFGWGQQRIARYTCPE
jgi:hypothetical protein